MTKDNGGAGCGCSDGRDDGGGGGGGGGPVQHQLQCLDAEVTTYNRLAYAETTKRTYSSQRTAFLRFCLYFGIQPVPCSQLNVCRYAVFLSRTLKPTSIPGYLNIVRLLHAEASLPNPMEDNWLLDILKRGITRAHGSPPKQKLPITPKILADIHTKLDLTIPFNATFWAVCVVAFFTFARKSTLLQKTTKLPADDKYLHRSDISFYTDYAILNIKHTKTIQYGQRVLQLPLQAIPNSCLCPIAAVEHMIVLSPTSTIADHLFTYSVTHRNRTKTMIPLTHDKFTKTLKLVLNSCGYNSSQYSGHSFRRGGATFAFNLGIPAILIIKQQGDWRSNAFERYTIANSDTKLKVAKTLALALADNDVD
ncbi:integrase/recombinase xerD homolog [Glandiceps talaboti]